MTLRRYLLVALVAFAAALATVLVVRIWIAPEPRVENEVHALLHQQLKLDPTQVTKTYLRRLREWRAEADGEAPH